MRPCPTGRKVVAKRSAKRASQPNVAAAAAFAVVSAHHGVAWIPSPSPKFGANALRVRDKIFAALTRRDQLLLKLPPARIEMLLAEGRAEPFTSGGRSMCGWVVLTTVDVDVWIAYSKEARAFVAATHGA